MDKPKHSVCRCGHTGDGPDSQHADEPLEDGHGACNVEGCSCERFVWARWIGNPGEAALQSESC